MILDTEATETNPSSRGRFLQDFLTDAQTSPETADSDFIDRLKPVATLAYNAPVYLNRSETFTASANTLVPLPCTYEFYREETRSGGFGLVQSSSSPILTGVFSDAKGWHAQDEAIVLVKITNQFGSDIAGVRFSLLDSGEAASDTSESDVLDHMKPHASLSYDAPVYVDVYETFTASANTLLPLPCTYDFYQREYRTAKERTLVQSGPSPYFTCGFFSDERDWHGPSDREHSDVGDLADIKVVITNQFGSDSATITFRLKDAPE